VSTTPKPPRPEIVHQPDGRDLIYFDGEIIGVLEIVKDVKDEGHRRIDYTVRSIGHSAIFGERTQRSLRTSLARKSGVRFLSEKDYDAWINDGDKPTVTDYEERPRA
jgi:hypothetical protein